MDEATIALYRKVIGIHRAEIDALANELADGVTVRRAQQILHCIDARCYAIQELRHALRPTFWQRVKGVFGC